MAEQKNVNCNTARGRGADASVADADGSDDDDDDDDDVSIGADKRRDGVILAVRWQVSPPARRPRTG